VGLGLIHYVPLVLYIGLWIVCLISLAGRPLIGLYYIIPLLPYRTLRDHFLDYPLGSNVLTILVVSVIVGAVLHGKHLPKSKLYLIWLIFGIYLYFSMWLGMALGNGPAPVWLSDANFVTWKDYMLIPLVFVATGLVVRDRKAVRTVIIILAISLLMIDRSLILETLSRSLTNFDENKRSSGPLGYGSNQTAAYLAQFAMFFWGLTQYVKTKKFKVAGYGLVAFTLFATMYTFSRGSYLAVLFSVFVLGLIKDRKLLLLGGAFLMTWQLIVPASVQQRVNMTQDSNGQLESSAESRVLIWQDAQASFLRSPIIGNGYATFQFGQHVDNLKDTHNWYVKVLVETGVVGMVFVLFLFQSMISVSLRLFRKATDPLYRGLGLGLFLAICACLIANFFGDRWTYLEITGQLWVMVGTAICALQIEREGAVVTETEESPTVGMTPYWAYR